MPTTRPRIQVTIDEELDEALGAVDPNPSSRSRLVRDLALRGAHAVAEDRRRADESLQVLLGIADGTHDHDFAAVAAAFASRDKPPA